MELRRLNDWLQLLASIGVLIGLFLVAYELRQEHELARTSLGGETFTSYENLMRSSQSESMAMALARAIESPADLTLGQHIMIDGYYWDVLTSGFLREFYMHERGIFGNVLTNDAVGEAAKIAASMIKSSDYGRAWWDVNIKTLAPDQREQLERATAGQEYPLFGERVREVEERLSEIREE